MKELSLGKTKFQFSKAAERNSKAKEERGKKAAQTGKKHREARRGPGSASTAGSGRDQIEATVAARAAAFERKLRQAIETIRRKR
jgi:hypothetical protein